MRAVLAVAEYGEDPFRLACLMTLTEIGMFVRLHSAKSQITNDVVSFSPRPVLVDIDLVARSGGLRVLLQVMADGPSELAPMVAMAVLYIVDAPRTRAYLNPGSDLEVLSGDKHNHTWSLIICRRLRYQVSQMHMGKVLEAANICAQLRVSLQ